MSLYDEWKKAAENITSQAEYEDYWKKYFEKEKVNYEYILENPKETVSGKLDELAQKFNMDATTFTGFLDGINTSLKNNIDLEPLTEESEITLDIDFEKLYWNMLDAKAEWLYNLSQWEDILSEEKRTEITKEFRRSKTAVSSKVGRNDPCPCGSGKKYKKCCGQ